MDTGLFYNSYSGIEMMPYKIITYLVENNQDVFKLLKYNTSDALSKDDLTCEEKAALIYNGQADSTLYNIFTQPITDDAFVEMIAQFRVFPVFIDPVDHIKGIVTFAFEILSHNKINTLDNYSTRILWMLQSTIQTLNGKNIDGLGDFFFNRNASSRDFAKLDLYNTKNYFGYTLYMSTWIGNIE